MTEPRRRLITTGELRDDTTSTFRRSELPGPLGVVLRVLNRATEPREYRLLKGSCVVGAGKEADLIVADETVSRRHVEFSLVAEGVAVRDLGSHNGTYYLGQRLQNAVLGIGSTVHLGRAELRLEADRESLAIEKPELRDRYGELISGSPTVQKLFALLARLESSLVNVLIEGESGTGKELIARAIHQYSPASAGNLVALNCAGMDRSLARSELFGHKRGAFTGAVDAREGAFEAADGGTLFLDEISELPLDVQPVLLRALEVGAVPRVGENTERPVKVRIVAATNRDLAAEVKAGRFREDLYFRLVVVHIKVPPLRERPDDIPVLAQHFAERFGLGGLPDEVIEELQSRSWPGNVRELRNAVQVYAAVGCLPERRGTREAELDEVLRQAVSLELPYGQQKDRLVKRFLRVYLETLLSHTAGNQSLAAKISGLGRPYLNRLAAQLRAGDSLDLDEPLK
jgi:DNA-binding NtrC family response regulator